MVDEKTLKLAQKVELEILKEVDRICKKHNIKYFINCGTLLGAVRHKGFIPWDDDIDVSMMRKDYEKFLSIVEDEIDENKFFVSNPKTDPLHPMNWTRICDVNSSVIHKSFEVSDEFHQALCIDIFPMKYVDDIFQHKFIRKCLAIVSKMQYIDPKKGTSKVKNFIKSIIFYLGFIKFCEFLYKKIYLDLPTKEKSNTISYDYNARVEPNFHIYSHIFPLTTIEFEGEIFASPNNPKEVLIDQYGPTYMTLPPEEKRQTHITDIFLNERCGFQKKLDKKREKK